MNLKIDRRSCHSVSLYRCTCRKSTGICQQWHKEPGEARFGGGPNAGPPGAPLECFASNSRESACPSLRCPSTAFRSQPHTYRIGKCIGVEISKLARIAGAAVHPADDEPDEQGTAEAADDRRDCFEGLRPTRPRMGNALSHSPSAVRPDHRSFRSRARFVARHERPRAACGGRLAGPPTIPAPRKLTGRDRSHLQGQVAASPCNSDLAA
jgi:hypothetical protein